MRTGAVFLADDSVLEPERSILLVERVGGQGEDTKLVTAHQTFR